MDYALHESRLPFEKPTFGLDKELLTLALPATGERLMMRAGDVVIIALVVSFGTEAVAGNAVGEVLTQFNYMPAFGVATATVMLVARAVGEDNWNRVDKLSKQAFWLSLVLMLPLTFSIYVLGIPLTHLYTTDSLAVEASVLVTLFSLLGTPMTIGTVILYSSLAGFGQCSASLLCDKYRNVVYPHWNRISDGDCAWLGLAWYLGRNPFG